MISPPSRSRLTSSLVAELKVWFLERRLWCVAGFTVFAVLVSGLVVAYEAQQEVQITYGDDVARRTVMRRILQMRAMAESAMKDCALAARLEDREALFDCRDALDALQGQAAGDDSRLLFRQTSSGFDVSNLDAFEQAFSALEVAFERGGSMAANSAFQNRGDDIVAQLSRIESAVWSQELRFRKVTLAQIASVHASLRFLFGIHIVSFFAFTFFFWRAFRSFLALRREKSFAAQQHRIMEGSLASAELALVAAGLAHEINNPLTIILGQAMRLGTREPEKFGALASTLIRQSERIGAVVKDFARATSPLPVNPLFTADVRETLEALSRFFLDARIRYAVFVDVELPPPNVRTSLPTHHLFQCLHNLVLNAIQALAESPVSLASGKKVVKVFVLFPANPEPGKEKAEGTMERGTCPLSIVVEDNGPGIEEGNRERIFLPFFSTHAQRRGLRLTAARTLAQLARGTVTLESARSPTRFVVNLPE